LKLEILKSLRRLFRRAGHGFFSPLGSFAAKTYINSQSGLIVNESGKVNSTRKNKIQNINIKRNKVANKKTEKNVKIKDSRSY